MGNLIHSAGSTVLSLECPSCRAAHQDDWECLADDEFASMRCSACNQLFYFYIKECVACGDESVFIWKHQPPPYLFELLGCQFCGEIFDDRIDISSNTSTTF